MELFYHEPIPAAVIFHVRFRRFWMWLIAVEMDRFLIMTSELYTGKMVVCTTAIMVLLSSLLSSRKRLLKKSSTVVGERSPRLKRPVSVSEEVRTAGVGVSAYQYTLFMAWILMKARIY